MLMMALAPIAVMLIFAVIVWFAYIGVCDIYEGFITPKWFYNNWKLNWFGSWFIFILFSIVNPIGTMFKLLYVIWYGVSHGIKWLFTVGR